MVPEWIAHDDEATVTLADCSDPEAKTAPLRCTWTQSERGLLVDTGAANFELLLGLGFPL
jgi:hypothetical protein